MSQTPDSIQTNILEAHIVCGILPHDYQTPYRNIGDVLQQQVAKNREKVWLVFYSDDNAEQGRVHYSYSEFYNLVRKTANLLLTEGISHGDRIATIAFNHADTVIQYFAAWLIGAVVVPINVGEDDRRIGYILRHSQAKLAFVRKQFIDRVVRIINETPSLNTIALVDTHNRSISNQPENPSDFTNPEARLDSGVRLLNFHDQVSKKNSEMHLDREPELGDEAMIVYTSGTTGLPKGVVLTHYNLLIDAKAIADWHRLTPGQVMMCVLPIHHVNGTVVTLMTPLYAGGSVVLNQKFHSDKFFERICNERVSIVSVVPTLLQFLLHENHDVSTYDLSQFRHIICGAGPLTVELASKFEEKFNIPIIHGYGLSETTCYSCFLPVDLPPDEHRRWLNDYGFPSIGVAISPNEMAIHDSEGREISEGVKGEIVIRGHNVMKCYYANREANDQAFKSGWFHSGDEGFFKTDPAGRKFFFITGRIKELIIRGGSNISPFEIDEVLMNIPGVKAGIAVGFDNDWYGEEIGAYVQPDAGATLSENDIISYCRRYFSFQKCPKVIIFGNDIPVTSTGKYQRNKLKPLFQQWKSIQFTESKHR